MQLQPQVLHPVGCVHEPRSVKPFPLSSKLSSHERKQKPTQGKGAGGEYRGDRPAADARAQYQG